ncbi:MAG: invasion associated locus B family protein [Pseudomonadota bacterium]|nr:invasion associated locus B family protein [Pseudomonadota bacterium]
MKFTSHVFAGSVASAALAAGLMAASLQPAQAQQEQPPRNGWFKTCSKQGENTQCRVHFQSVANTGQLLTAISLLEVTGEVDRKRIQITVPSGRFIPAGIKLQVDDGKEGMIPYLVCMQQVCVAEVPLDAAVIGQFKGGGQLTVTSTNFQNRPNPVQITLEGFTAAYDGPPLKQDELEARQQQLQEELRKKAEERRKKLQEEQEKAKAAGSAQ